MKNLIWTANHTKLNVLGCSNFTLGEKVFPLNYNVNFSAFANGTNVTYTWNFPSGERINGSRCKHKFNSIGDKKITLTAENAVSKQEETFALKLYESILNVSLTNDGPSKKKQTVNFTLTAKQFGSNSCFNISLEKELRYFNFNSLVDCGDEGGVEILAQKKEFYYAYNSVGEYVVSLNAAYPVSCVKLNSKVAVASGFLWISSNQVPWLKR